MRRVNETFDFDNDNIDLDSGVISQAREYKLYNLLVKIYEEGNFNPKFLAKTLGKVISYIFDNAIDFGYASLGNVVDIWIEIQEEPYISVQYEIESIKDFYDLARKFSQKIYNESKPDFIKRLLSHAKPEFKNTLNESFDFENDDISLDSDVSKMSRKYKLKERILSYYKKNIESRKWNYSDLGVTLLEHVIKNLFKNKVKTNSYRDANGGQISIDFTDFDNTRPYGGGLSDMFFFEPGDFYKITDDFVDQLFDTNRHKREVHNEESRKFLERFLNNLSEPINEAFDFDDEEPDYDKDIKENLNRIKLYRKFKRLLHAEVDAIGNDIVNYGGLTELFTALMAYGFYIGYSTMNLTLGPDCDVKYYNYGRITPSRESFKLDIGVIELGKNSEAEVIQNLKDGLDKIVDLIDKRKDEVYDDFLDRCMSNIWVTKFFRAKEKVNKLPYKFVDYINES